MIDDKQKKALERFFHEDILAVAKGRGGDGAHPAAGRPEAPESYWIQRDSHKLAREDFEIGMADRDEIGDSLDAFWKGTAYEGLGKRLCKLSRLFSDVKEKDKVSSFIYEMF